MNMRGKAKRPNGRARRPIKIQESHEGMLHDDTGTPEDEPIPEEKLEEALNSDDPAVRRRAQFAKNAKSWRH